MPWVVGRPSLPLRGENRGFQPSAEPRFNKYGGPVKSISPPFQVTVSVGVGHIAKISSPENSGLRAPGLATVGIREFFMVFRGTSILIVLCCLSLNLGAIEAPLPRHPAPSPDGSMIAFDWQGDIWIIGSSGGTPTRLTANPAHDMQPVFSRDGRMLAFASNRFGSFDVFVMAADGGSAPRRLSFADRDDFPVDFSPDGAEVLFTSSRGLSVRWMPTLWSVAVSGGTPRIAQDALGEHARYSPGGNALLFIRGATKWTRHGYHGTASRSPWLRSPDGEYFRLSDFDGDEDYPGWIDDHEIILLSSRSPRKNIFRMNLINGEVEQLTHHENTDVRSPSISADGTLVAYEFEDRIRVLRLGSGESTLLHIDAPPDPFARGLHRSTETSGARDLDISPDGTLAAFIVEGDLFISEITDKEDQEIAAPRTLRLTRGAAEEAHPRFSPDGSAILFSSDREDSEDLWLIRPDDSETAWIDSFDFPTMRLSTSRANEHDAQWSPDGNQIAYVRGKGDLMICDADGSNTRVLLEHWESVDFSFSPDGRYLAYSTVDVHYNSEVWVIPVEGGTPYNLSRHPDDDLQPRWSPDGQRLLWVSKSHRDSFDVWGVWLRREDDRLLPAERLKVFKEEMKSEEDEKGDENHSEADEKGANKPLPEVEIDFDGLWRRVRRLTSEQGDESAPQASPDGRCIIFVGEAEGKKDLYRARWDGKKTKRLTRDGAAPVDIHFGPKGKNIFFLNQKGLIKRVDLKGKEGDPIPFSARCEIDVHARREEVFSQVWDALNDWFYDPDFHGVDWPSKRSIYHQLALEAPDTTDFADILNLMLGELNASHMGYYPPTKNGDETSGWLGLDFDSDAGGPGLLIQSVIPEGPADAPSPGLRSGDRILSIASAEILPDTNVYELLIDRADRKTPIEILRADGRKVREFILPWTWGQEREKRYESWVRQRQELCNRYSGGRLGYLHIHSMDIPSFETFERDLQAAGEGRDGLIIDVRSNGGGWTTDYLMAVLMVQRHAYTVPRDDKSGTRAYPQSRLPLAAWTRPAATLCNEDSYSNAEIFSHAFKTLHRGPLIGNTTFGAVISTSGQDLPDGGFVRTPMRGWYVAASGVNMENNGAVPDVVVLQPPVEDMSKAEDIQLRRAVEFLLDEMPTDPRRDAW